MSSTVRVYVNDRRIATGKMWKNQFLQVYPEKKTFASEAEWRTSIYANLMPTIRFVTTEAPVKVQPKLKEEVNPVVKAEEKEETNQIVRPEPIKIPTITTDKNNWMYQKMRKMILPPGTYYIGDLCYALDETLYDTIFGPQYREGYYCSKSNPSDVFMMSGTGGDGEFRGTDGKMYPVDAGIIGIASESTLDKKKKFTDCGSMYTFKGNVHVKFREDKFQFSSDTFNDPYLTIYVYEENYDDSE